MDQAEELDLVAGDGTSSYIGHIPAVPNLCIPATNLEDGPNGVGDGAGGVTAFPDGESAAATFDPTLIKQEGSAMGAEFAGKGVNVALGPTTNLVRDPRWGRTYETYGEDPYLAGQITSAEVTGLQSQDVMAMVKHVAAYDQEQFPNGTNNETVSQQALEELYLAPFQATAEQAAPASMMCSYAVVNGNASCQNADMQIKGLDNEANYGGFLTSDWGADYNNVASVAGGMDVGLWHRCASCAGVHWGRVLRSRFRRNLARVQSLPLRLQWDQASWRSLLRLVVASGRILQAVPAIHQNSARASAPDVPRPRLAKRGLRDGSPKALVARATL